MANKKEIPMLFSTAMVQAILEGRKTETRRVVKPNKVVYAPTFGFTAFTPERHVSVRGTHQNGEYGESFIKCPYGKVGDVIWVRETFIDGMDYCGADEIEEGEDPRYGYKADCPEDQRPNITWKPSIHMPKDGARIWLEVTGIEVERLQDISEEAAIAEGIKCLPSNDAVDTLYYHYLKNKWGPSAIHSYQTLWEKINGVGSWLANPFVWVVKFKVLSTTGKPNVI